MPKKSTLKKRLKALEAKLAQATKKAKAKTSRRGRTKGRSRHLRPTPIYCEDSCRSTCRERCCDDTCYGGFGRTPCYRDCCDNGSCGYGCGDYGYDCGPCGPCGPCGYGCGPGPCGPCGPYPWAPAPYPTFPCVSVLPGATIVETSCLPTY